MSQKILFLESQEFCSLPDISSLKIAAEGCEIICLSDMASAKGVIDSSKSIEVFVANTPSFELYTAVVDLHPDASTVLVTDLPMSEYSRLLQNQEEILLDHVISNVSSMRWVINDLRTTLQKIIRKDYFGLEKYFLPGTQVFSRQITGSSDRESLNTEVMKYAEQLRLGNYISKLLFSITEELIMNAVYDAPLAAGRIDPETQDSKTVELAEEDQSTLFYGFDGDIFGVCLVDPFGALTKRKLFTYLKKVLDRDNSSKIIDSKRGGAGLGLFKILYSSHAVLCNVRPKKKTEVIALIDVHQQVRDFSKCPRTIHFFSC